MLPNSGSYEQSSHKHGVWRCVDLSFQLGFPGGSAIKNPPANAGDVGLILGSGRSPGEGNGNPLQYSCLDNPHGLRSLVAYTSWRHKSVGHD